MTLLLILLHCFLYKQARNYEVLIFCLLNKTVKPTDFLLFNLKHYCSCVVCFFFSWQNTDQTESSVKQICSTQLTRKRYENRDLGLKEKPMLRAYNYHSGWTVPSKVRGETEPMAYISDFPRIHWSLKLLCFPLQGFFERLWVMNRNRHTVTVSHSCALSFAAQTAQLLQDCCDLWSHTSRHSSSLKTPGGKAGHLESCSVTSGSWLQDSQFTNSPSQSTRHGHPTFPSKLYCVVWNAAIQMFSFSNSTERGMLAKDKRDVMASPCSGGCQLVTQGVPTTCEHCSKVLGAVRRETNTTFKTP